MKPTRDTFLAAALACEGIPYVYGGKTTRGLDCSGLVTWALRACGGPDLRGLHDSDRLFLELPPVVEPVGGDLAFYGVQGDPSHVVICLGGPHDQILGACGGTPKTLTVALADEVRACVKRKNAPNYRPDFLGFRSTERWWAPSP